MIFRRDEGGAPVSYGASGLSRIFGGSPIAVVVKLALMCVIVGLILDQLDLNALELFRWAAREIEELIENSADLLRLIGRYFLIGAMVVIPVWIVLRVLKLGAGRR